MTLDHAGPFRSARLRLLPWRPRLRGDRDWVDVGDVGNVDIGGDDLGFGMVLLVGLLLLAALPVVVVLLVFSLELVLLAMLLPFALLGQMLGLLPWQIAVRTTDGRKHYVSVRGTRSMLDALRHYRSLVQTSRS